MPQRLKQNHKAILIIVTEAEMGKVASLAVDHRCKEEDGECKHCNTAVHWLQLFDFSPLLCVFLNNYSKCLQRWEKRRVQQLITDVKRKMANASNVRPRNVSLDALRHSGLL